MSAIERNFIPIKELFFPEGYNYSKFSASLTRLIAAVGLGAVQAIQAKTYRAFDANPGDGGCQNRAFTLRRMAFINFDTECQEIEEWMRAIPQKVTPSQLKDPEFFEKYLGDLSLSPEMAYFMLCYFLTSLKQIDNVSDNGVITTKTDLSLMRFLHPRQYSGNMAPKWNQAVCFSGSTNSFAAFS